MHPAAATRPGPPSPPAWDWSAARRTCLREARRFLAPPDAEDAVQNALARAWKARHACDNPEAPLGWMLSITRNEALRQLEGRKRLTEREPPTDTTQVDEPAPASQEEHLLDELAVSARLSRLRPEERALVRLCYVHEVPHGDLARVLGISEATVRVRLHRICERARNVLSGE